MLWGKSVENELAAAARNGKNSLRDWKFLPIEILIIKFERDHGLKCKTKGAPLFNPMYRPKIHLAEKLHRPT